MEPSVHPADNARLNHERLLLANFSLFSSSPLPADPPSFPPNRSFTSAPSSIPDLNSLDIPTSPALPVNYQSLPTPSPYHSASGFPFQIYPTASFPHVSSLSAPSQPAQHVMSLSPPSLAPASNPITPSTSVYQTPSLPSMTSFPSAPMPSFSPSMPTQSAHISQPPPVSSASVPHATSDAPHLPSSFLLTSALTVPSVLTPAIVPQSTSPKSRKATKKAPTKPRKKSPVLKRARQKQPKSTPSKQPAGRNSQIPNASNRQSSPTLSLPPLPIAPQNASLLSFSDIMAAPPSQAYTSRQRPLSSPLENSETHDVWPNAMQTTSKTTLPAPAFSSMPLASSRNPTNVQRRMSNGLAPHNSNTNEKNRERTTRPIQLANHTPRPAMNAVQRQTQASSAASRPMSSNENMAARIEQRSGMDATPVHSLQQVDGHTTANASNSASKSRGPIQLLRKIGKKKVPVMRRAKARKALAKATSVVPKGKDASSGRNPQGASKQQSQPIQAAANPALRAADVASSTLVGDGTGKRLMTAATPQNTNVTPHASNFTQEQSNADKTFCRAKKNSISGSFGSLVRVARGSPSQAAGVPEEPLLRVPGLPSLPQETTIQPGERESSQRRENQPGFDPQVLLRKGITTSDTDGVTMNLNQQRDFWMNSFSQGIRAPQNTPSPQSPELCSRQRLPTSENVIRPPLMSQPLGNRREPSFNSSPGSHTLSNGASAMDRSSRISSSNFLTVPGDATGNIANLSECRTQTQVSNNFENNISGRDEGSSRNWRSSTVDHARNEDVLGQPGESNQLSSPGGVAGKSAGPSVKPLNRTPVDICATRTIFRNSPFQRPKFSHARSANDDIAQFRKDATSTPGNGARSQAHPGSSVHENSLLGQPLHSLNGHIPGSTPFFGNLRPGVVPSAPALNPGPALRLLDPSQIERDMDRNRKVPLAVSQPNESVPVPALHTLDASKNHPTPAAGRATQSLVHMPQDKAFRQTNGDLGEDSILKKDADNKAAEKARKKSIKPIIRKAKKAAPSTQSGKLKVPRRPRAPKKPKVSTISGNRRSQASETCNDFPSGSPGVLLTPKVSISASQTVVADPERANTHSFVGEKTDMRLQSFSGGQERIDAPDNTPSANEPSTVALMLKLPGQGLNTDASGGGKTNHPASRTKPPPTPRRVKPSKRKPPKSTSKENLSTIARASVEIKKAAQPGNTNRTSPNRVYRVPYMPANVDYEGASPGPEASAGTISGQERATLLSSSSAIRPISNPATQSTPQAPTRLPSGTRFTDGLTSSEQESAPGPREDLLPKDVPRFLSIPSVQGQPIKNNQQPSEAGIQKPGDNGFSQIRNGEGVAIAEIPRPHFSGECTRQGAAKRNISKQGPHSSQKRNLQGSQKRSPVRRKQNPGSKVRSVVRPREQTVASKPSTTKSTDAGAQPAEIAQLAVQSGSAFPDVLTGHEHPLELDDVPLAQARRMYLLKRAKERNGRKTSSKPDTSFVRGEDPSLIHTEKGDRVIESPTQQTATGDLQQAGRSRPADLDADHQKGSSPSRKRKSSVHSEGQRKRSKPRLPGAVLMRPQELAIQEEPETLRVDEASDVTDEGVVRELPEPKLSSRASDSPEGVIELSEPHNAPITKFGPDNETFVLEKEPKNNERSSSQTHAEIAKTSKAADRCDGRDASNLRLRLSFTSQDENACNSLRVQSPSPAPKQRLSLKLRRKFGKTDEPAAEQTATFGAIPKGSSSEEDIQAAEKKNAAPCFAAELANLRSAGVLSEGDTLFSPVSSGNADADSATAWKVPCVLCQTDVPYDETVKHPSFPIRSFDVCRTCAQLVSKRVAACGAKRNETTFSSTEAVVQSTTLFVMLLEDMVRHFLPSGRVDRDVQHIYDFISNRGWKDMIERVESLSVPLNMLTVLRVALRKLGFSIRNGKFRWPTGAFSLPPFSDILELISNAIPPQIEDMKKGILPAVAAWNHAFGDHDGLEVQLSSYDIYRKLASLIGLRLCHDKECSGQETGHIDCKFSFEPVSLSIVIHRVTSMVSGTAMKDLMPASWSKEEAARYIEEAETRLTNEFFGGELRACCVCGDSGPTAENSANQASFSCYKSCKSCSKVFCDFCLLNVLGTTEYISSFKETFRCMICRFQDNAQINPGGLKSGMTENRRLRLRTMQATKAKGMQRNPLHAPLLILSSATRRAVLFQEDSTQSADAVGMARLCDVVNRRIVQTSMHVEAADARHEICLKCKRPAESTVCEDQDNVLVCGVEQCMNVMHRACLPPEKVARRRLSRSKWICPHHQCESCELRDETKLVRCRTCPSAYCKEHMPPPSDAFVFSEKLIACSACKLLLRPPTLLRLKSQSTKTERKRSLVAQALMINHQQQLATVQKITEVVGPTPSRQSLLEFHRDVESARNL